MVCHHGAGYSGISFACFAKEVTEMSKGDCGVLSLDARRHGMFIFDAISPAIVKTLGHFELLDQLALFTVLTSSGTAKRGRAGWPRK
jgi:hypothetical protein